MAFYSGEGKIGFTGMTHSAIISEVYTNFSDYLALWRQNHAAAEELGALVFLPGRDLNWEWWSMGSGRI